MLAARKRPITTLSVSDLKTGPLERLESRGTRAPEAEGARIFEGSPAVTARQLVAELREAGVL